MKNKYEALLVLNTKGNEDGANKIIDRLESEFKKEGADVEQVQRLDRRTSPMSRVPWTPGIS